MLVLTGRAVALRCAVGRPKVTLRCFSASPLTAAYARMVERKSILPSKEQAHLAHNLDTVYRQVYERGEFHPSSGTVTNVQWPWLVRMLGQPIHTIFDLARGRKIPENSYALGKHWSNAVNYGHTAALPPVPVKGLYIWGAVGTGKSMLMDLFHAQVQQVVPKARRVHFNTFVQIDLHLALYKLGGGSHIPELAKRIAHDCGGVLCFDEFQITDIGDAFLLKSLFEHLFLEHHVVMVATSNRDPVTLYKGGVNVHLFEPFIRTLQHCCETVELTSVLGDHRTAALDLEDLTYLPHYILPEQAASHVHYKRLPLARTTFDLPFGRTVEVSTACGEEQQAGLTVVLDLAELRQMDLGPNDLSGIVKAATTVVLRDMQTLRPLDSQADRNVVRRVVLLIDEVYEQKKQLVVLADCPMADLFATERSADGVEANTSLEREQWEEVRGYSSAADQGTPPMRAWAAYQPVKTVLSHELESSVLPHELKSSFAFDPGEDLFKQLFSGEEEKFAARRCISRLKEMNTAAWIQGA